MNRNEPFIESKLIQRKEKKSLSIKTKIIRIFEVLRNIHSKKIIMDTTWKMIHKYIVEEFNFPWFTGWSAFTPTKFHRYDVNTNMKEHCDHIHSIFDGQLKGVPILSVLSSLNEDYEGGDLIFFENEKIDLKTGDVMIFPSNFMYPHKVTPVTKGQRYSMVNWVW